jgi:DNA-directed RNA polymerase
MVVPYAGTFSSCLEYTRAAVLEKIKDGYPCPWTLDDSADHTRRISLLAKLIWDAIDQTVVKGKEAMRWLSLAARDYSKWANINMPGDAYAKRMSWVTPDGFEAIHYRANQKESRVCTYLDGRVDLVYLTEMTALSAPDMSLAVAPNWVHSLDANLLRASIVKGLSMDISSYAMVHDSFGVHAARMAEFLVHCVKPAFIEMYDQDVLRQFTDRIPPEVSLDPIPTSGSLDPNGVQDSEFFFS